MAKEKGEEGERGSNGCQGIRGKEDVTFASR